MENVKVASRRLLAAVIGISLAGCAALTSDDSTGESVSAIVNGTPETLGQNSFVRLPVPDCTGTLLDNHWILTANHCTSHAGDPVYMDNQVGTVARVVANPDVLGDVDIALVELAAPMTVAGTTTAFRRRLQTTVALPGTHVRCFGYGEPFNGTGTTAQLRLMELGTSGGANSVYFFERNALGQSAAPGDAGGACLDDGGYVLAVMRSYTSTPTSLGETAAITSQYYAAWADSVLASCLTNSDCLTTGICNTTTNRCVASKCSDGVKDNGETGVDCGGSCPLECRRCPGALFDCGDGRCVRFASLCP